MALRDPKASDEFPPHEEDRPRRPSYRLSRPIVGDFDPAILHQPQGPDSGINAIIGKWPGDESDEEILALLEELS
jgi:hypothetical protein